MSLIPFLISDVMDEFNRPHSIFDLNFGLGLLNDDLLHPRHISMVPSLSGYYRPCRRQAAQQSGTSKLVHSDGGFKVNLDVQQFKPEEINVKLVDKFVVVEGKHEERQDEHGFITRCFSRRYKLPDSVELEGLTSKLSSDGVLTIEAPKRALPTSASEERVLNIVHTNAPAIRDMQEQGNTNDVSQEKMNQ